MIKIAILEHEKETKDIAFQLAGLLKEIDWTFRHFYKASELAKASKEEQYHIFIFDEIFRTPRLENVFIQDNPSALILYICQDPLALQENESRQRVLYLSKEYLKQDLERFSDLFLAQAKQNDVYSLQCGSVQVQLLIDEIYYLEKIDKNVYFHTAKGKFHRRLNLTDLEKYFESYGFMRVHVSYVVNRKYITSIEKDEVVLNSYIRIPLSRSQKKRLGLQVRHRQKISS